jgi:hypothetical protein
MPAHGGRMCILRRGGGEHEGLRLMQRSMASCFLSLPTAVAPLGFFVVVAAVVVFAAAVVFAIVDLRWCAYQ